MYHRGLRALVAAILALTGTVQVRGTAPAIAACARPFTLYDNTHYSDRPLAPYAVTRSGVFYEDAAERESIAAGHVPDKRAFIDAVAAEVQAPGPLVLDFEDLYLTGTPAIATFHLRVLTLLASWAHQAAPRMVIGFYGLLGHTATAYLPLARRLAPLEDAFFPSLYTFDDDHALWEGRLQGDMQQAQAIDPRKPVYPYIWPQYHEHTPRALQYLDAAYWSFQLRSIHALANGAVIWSGGGPNGSAAWVVSTAQFLRTSASC